MGFPPPKKFFWIRTVSRVGLKAHYHLPCCNTDIKGPIWLLFTELKICPLALIKLMLHVICH